MIRALRINAYHPAVSADDRPRAFGDFVDWCDHVLARIAEEVRASPAARSMGLDQMHLRMAVFGEAAALAPELHGSRRHGALMDAVAELERTHLLEQRHRGHWKLSDIGERVLPDRQELWEASCARELTPERRQLLELVNRLSPRVAEDGTQAWLEWVAHDQLLAELGWERGMDLLWPVAEELEEQSLVVRHATLGPNLQLHATYRGLVWQMRRGLTVESRFIDDPVAEWETTSVEFKRDVLTDTASEKAEKAEFVKDLLGLANTQASGRRWLIIGFDPKTRAYHGPPSTKLSQDHLEQLAAAYTDPPVGLRYDVVTRRLGPVGRIEVVRERTKVPYRVRQSVGFTGRGGRRVEAGQIFVRHGSQTEEPTPGELGALHAEGDRARQDAFSAVAS